MSRILRTSARPVLVAALAVLAAFDRTVRPQDDFNRFVNGTWMKTTEIPADGSTWGSFVELADKSDAAPRLAGRPRALEHDAADGQRLLTLGENVGDLSGLAVAHRAYRMSLGGTPAPVIDGFTGDQRFFLGWAQVWRTRMRDDALRQRLLTDPHSPGDYRALVPLTNLQAFYDAWDVKPGDRMYRPPNERVTIW